MQRPVKGTVVQDMLVMLLHALLPEGLVAAAALLHRELSPVSPGRSGPQAHPQPPSFLPALGLGPSWGLCPSKGGRRGW